MKVLKKICMLAAVFVMTAGLLACEAPSGSAEKKEDKLRIVATIFPEYDWVRNIIGENSEAVEVTLLLDKGVDMHSYQPSAEDILKVSAADLFIYVGGESDSWVEDALKETVNENQRALNLLEILGDLVKEEEIIEGMEDEHDHEHSDHAEEGEEEHEEHEEEHHGEPEVDEHVWLSLKNAGILVEKISEEIAAADPENAETYRKNAKSYQEKLAALDSTYSESAGKAPFKTLLFGDRFPFRYLTDDYGLGYFAAFPGCSAETEASFETVSFLSGKLDELKLPAVLVIEGSDQRIAKTIIENTEKGDQKILILDSMQGTSGSDLEDGVTYLSVMEKNLAVLAEALGLE